ncbi:MAG: sigma-54 dependent transcriptional regulator [Alphaproteobacteria bacterium]|nr:sigma-54 dependent transcriptional regulator [Alphaproteobacteria bacterium]MBU1562798.1 sigma-54 dependent transcriptional regulator [Alphaproteobacteria bacterium]MBU2301415.1 sigma-54 dependent transcriptional regulator [Alphaproteobacteria bacterium]MBU2368118.1 sigma-54 dependent transcriptional regulator [Alphaproteobacteria bacterium]
MHTRSDGEPFGRLLLIDGDDAGAPLVAETLTQSLGGSLRITVAAGGRHAAELLRDTGFDIVLADLSSLHDLSERSDDAVGRLVRLADGALVVALSDGASVSAAVGAMRAGAHDYVVKPVSGPAMAARIGELAQRHGKARALSIEPRNAGRADFAGFIGASSAMQFVYEQIGRIATSSAPVFITGESGTGKDVCAEALHAEGPRFGKRLVAINCAAIPRDLMESELFGVARGAFTGAHEDRKGAAELADGGTLFLDEIGEMDLSLQSKLLRFLQTGTLSRVGESGVRHVDVRVICATNRNPMQLITEKRFREDLFYRLHVLPIHLPPLRQRPTDIMVLARHFLALYAAEEHKRFSGFSPEVASLLTSAEWPGNVRQLQNLVRRLVVMCDGGEITMPMLSAADIESRGVVAAAEPTPRAERRQPILPMWQQEQRIIEDAIASFGGNVSLAAAALEISPSTIYRKRQGWAEMAAAS